MSVDRISVGLPIELPPGERAAVVDEANRAPSVHNVQPVRWRFACGEVRLRLDPARGLPVGDAKGFDAALSLGCALEGTRIALARRGIGADMHLEADATATLALRDVLPGERAKAERDHERMDRRRTHRLGFARPSDADRAALAAWTARWTARRTARWTARRTASARGNLAATTDGGTIAALAALNDAASLRFLRDDAYRGELLGWMRLRPNDPNAERDGLGAATLGLGRGMAWAAGLALGPLFGALDRIGLAAMATSERDHTLRAAGIGAVTMPRDADRPAADIRAGVAFLRATLDLAALGHQTWPMGVLADDDRSRERTARLLALPPDRLPRIVFRIGRPADATAPPPRARVPGAELIDDGPAEATWQV